MITIVDPEVKYPDIVKVLTFLALILLAVFPLFWKIENAFLLMLSIQFCGFFFAGLRILEILLHHRSKKIKKLPSVLAVNFIIFFTIGFGIGLLFYVLYQAFYLT